MLALQNIGAMFKIHDEKCDFTMRDGVIVRLLGGAAFKRMPLQQRETHIDKVWEFSYAQTSLGETIETQKKGE